MCVCVCEGVDTCIHVRACTVGGEKKGERQEGKKSSPKSRHPVTEYTYT